jgi:hypothetical protein
MAKKKERQRPYTESEMEHACGKLRFIPKNTKPKFGQAFEEFLDDVVEDIAAEEAQTA